MRSGRTNSDDWRLFVAVYPPEATAQALLGAAERSIESRGRLTPVEQVHLTMQFIGDTRTKDLERIRESVARSASGIEPFTLRPLRLITLPERGPARLVAAETDAPPGLLEMQRRLAQRLARSPRKSAGDRFLPHLTLFRAARGSSCDRVEAPLEIDGFGVGSLVLMRSVLRSGGAAHTEVARFPLG